MTVLQLSTAVAVAGAISVVIAGLFERNEQGIGGILAWFVKQYYRAIFGFDITE